MDRKEIQAWIKDKEKQYISDIFELVKIPSISEYTDHKDKPYGEHCFQVMEKASQICHRLNLHVDVKSPHYLSVREFCENEYSVGIFSHLDVVPTGEVGKWQKNPFCPYIDRGYIMGRGARDDKGPAVLSLYALKYLKEHNIPMAYNLLLYFGVDEEKGASDLEYFKRCNKEPDFSFTPDAKFPVCYGEKGLFDVDLGCLFKSDILCELKSGEVKNTIPDKAYAILRMPFAEVASIAEQYDFNGEITDVIEGTKITTTGLSKHAAFPEGAKHAVVPLIQFLIEAHLIEDENISILNYMMEIASDFYGEKLGYSAEDSISGKLTSIMGMLSIKENKCIANMNIRYPVLIDAKSIIKKIKEVMYKCGLDICVNSQHKPNYVDPKHPVISIMNKAYRKVYANEDKPYTMGGGTYARYLNNTAVAFGPHNRHEVAPDGIGGAHQVNEGISLVSLRRGLEVYILTLLSINRFACKKSKINVERCDNEEVLKAL